MTLTLTDVTLTYPDGGTRLTALDRVSLHVAAGTLTAVVGPSGSGKSSLLAVAATLVTPTGEGSSSRERKPPGSVGRRRPPCAGSASASSSSSRTCCRR